MTQSPFLVARRHNDVFIIYYIMLLPAAPTFSALIMHVKPDQTIIGHVHGCFCWPGEWRNFVSGFVSSLVTALAVGAMDANCGLEPTTKLRRVG